MAEGVDVAERRSWAEGQTSHRGVVGRWVTERQRWAEGRDEEEIGGGSRRGGDGQWVAERQR